MLAIMMMVGFPGGSVAKNLPANAGDTGSTPESQRAPGGGNGNLKLYIAFIIYLHCCNKEQFPEKSNHSNIYK